MKIKIIEYEKKKIKKKKVNGKKNENGKKGKKIGK